MEAREHGWFDTDASGTRWAEAEQALRRDPVLRAAVRRVGRCTLRPRRDYFRVLTLSLFNQQLATATAATLYKRFAANFPGSRPTPQRVIDALEGGLDDAHLRWCGLSRQKKGYLLSLAHHFVDGRIPTRKLRRLDDETVIELLTSVRGIGRWTGQIFLMFALNRPDIWPVADLGLKESARVALGRSERPSEAELEAIGERFRPWRTVATWYLWRGRASGVWSVAS